MIPVFEIFGKTFSAYMILALIGYLVTIFIMIKIAIKNKLDEFHILYILLFAAIGILIGGHTLYGITNIELIVKLIKKPNIITSFKVFIDYMMIIFGGSVFYGGMIGSVLVAYIYIKIKNISCSQYMGTAVMAIPLFHFFGRVGCFLSGCCYGVEWEHGVTYHYSVIEQANGVPRFPVQLIEAGINAVLFFLLLFIYNRRKSKVNTFYTYFLIYPICRFLLEFLRGDKYRGFLFGLSTSQIISIILIIVTLVIFLVNKKRKFQLE